MPEIRGKQEICENGWQNVAIWDGQQTTGDYTVGEEYCAYYELAGTDWRAEITFWATAQGSDGKKWEDLEYGFDPEDYEEVRYAVDERSEIFTAEEGDQGNLETEYGEGSYLFYDTVEAAEKEALRLVSINWDHAFAPKSFFIEKYPDTINKEEAQHGT